MFAKTKADIPGIVNSLLDDELIKQQGIVVREYVPLKTFHLGINDLPITNEWRIFCLFGKPVIGGYYWSSELPDCINDTQNPPSDAWNLAKKVCDIVGNEINFFVVDVAEKADGGWIVIELNDAQMAGLSMIDLDRFYSTLKENL